MYLGPGGIGKTSVALAVMENDAVENKFSKENCFWFLRRSDVPWSSSSNSVFNLRITRTRAMLLVIFVLKLQASTDPGLFYSIILRHHGIRGKAIRRK